MEDRPSAKPEAQINGGPANGNPLPAYFGPRFRQAPSSKGDLYVAAQVGSGNVHNGVYVFNAPLKCGKPNAYARLVPLDQVSGLTVAPRP